MRDDHVVDRSRPVGHCGGHGAQSSVRFVSLHRDLHGDVRRRKSGRIGRESVHLVRVEIGLVRARVVWLDLLLRNYL